MDVSITDNGTTFSVRPFTERAWDWLDENVAARPWQWIGPSLVVEWRLAARLREAMEADGLLVNRSGGTLH